MTNATRERREKEFFFFFSEVAHWRNRKRCSASLVVGSEQTAHRFVLMVSVLLPVAWQHICHDSTGYSYLFNAMQETWKGGLES